jgi:hypothetical protein
MQPDNGIHRAGQFGIHLKLKGVLSENSAVRTRSRKNAAWYQTTKNFIYLRLRWNIFNCCQDLNPPLRKRETLDSPFDYRLIALHGSRLRTMVNSN